LQDFFALPRFPFTAAAVSHAPEEGGIYGLFISGELIYLGAASGRPGVRKYPWRPAPDCDAILGSRLP